MGARRSAESRSMVEIPVGGWRDFGEYDKTRAIRLRDKVYGLNRVMIGGTKFKLVCNDEGRMVVVHLPAMRFDGGGRPSCGQVESLSNTKAKSKSLLGRDEQPGQDGSATGDADVAAVHGA